MFECLVFELLGLLPGEDLTAKVTIGGRLLEDGVLQLEILDNAARSEVKVVLDNLHELLGGLGSSSVVKHSDREGLSNTNSVGHLYNNITLVSLVVIYYL